MYYLFVGPGVGKPSDYSCFQLFGNSSEGHVLFDAVHAVLELYSSHVHVADHTTDIAHDCGKNEHAGKEIGHHKYVFQFVFRLWCFPCKPFMIKFLKLSLNVFRLIVNS